MGAISLFLTALFAVPHKESGLLFLFNSSWGRYSYLWLKSQYKIISDNFNFLS